MANPDSTSASSNMGGIMTLAFFIGILVIILFNYQTIPLFNAILYGILPIFIYFLMVIVIYISKTGTSIGSCLLYTSPSPRDRTRSRMPSSA